jgi:hypothetical protein
MDLHREEVYGEHPRISHGRWEHCAAGPATQQAPSARGDGFWHAVEDQFAIRQFISEYLIPAETNNLWHTLGGVLAIALVLEMLTGFVLAFAYNPDAGQAYDITRTLIQTPVWSVVINFHFWKSFLIFGLVLLHMVRVFVTGAYRGVKTGLWLTGVGLAGATFLLSLTGESLHWDEVGFAVPWHISEFFQAIGLAGAFGYAFAELRAIPSATNSARSTPCTSRWPALARVTRRVALLPDQGQGNLAAFLVEGRVAARRHSVPT